MSMHRLDLTRIRPGILPQYRTQQTLHRWSDGLDAGALIAGKLKRRPTLWQQYVLDVALERVDGPGSPFAYPNVDAIVGRRCGKSVTSMGVPLYRSLVGPVTLDSGRVMPFFGAHTAQNLVKARQRFMKDLVEPYRESMSPQVWRSGVKLRESIGDTGLIIDPRDTGKDWRWRRASSISVFAPTRSSVRGDGLMHLTFDEYLVFSLVSGQDLMAAAGPTLGDARGHGQIWRVSNVSLLNNELTALWEMKERGRAAVDAGATSGTAYFEFTVPDDFDLDDEDGYARHYPAITDGIIRLEELRADRVRLGDDSFAAEYFGKWPTPGQLTPLWSTIGRDAWAAIAAPVDVELGGGLAALGVDIDPYDRSAAIVATVVDDDGLLQEIIDERPGSAWVAARLRELAPTVDAIGVDDYGPGHDLLEALVADPVTRDKLVPVKSADFIAACFAWDSRVRDRRVRIRASDHFAKATAAAAAAQRTAGKAWQWERRLPTPQSTIVGATLSAWALGRAPEPESFFVQ